MNTTEDLLITRLRYLPLDESAVAKLSDAQVQNLLMKFWPATYVFRRAKLSPDRDILNYCLQSVAPGANFGKDYLTEEILEYLHECK